VSRYTAADVASLLGVDPKTVHNWVEKGAIRAARTEGRHLRFTRADVVAFLRKQDFPIPRALRETKPLVAIVGEKLALPYEQVSYPHLVDLLIDLERREPDAILVPRGAFAEECAARLAQRAGSPPVVFIEGDLREKVRGLLGGD
jgi:excisionase family DNA binding protein